MTTHGIDGTVEVLRDVVRQQEQALRKKSELIHELTGKLVQCREALKELALLMEDVRAGNYAPDSFTTQPAKIVLALLTGQHDKDCASQDPSCFYQAGCNCIPKGEK
jgi:hypothetical protein